MGSVERKRRKVEPGQMELELEQVADVLRENQKLITLGRLAASIAHEINNPLESVTNLLYLMEKDKSENIGKYLRLAQSELERIVQISRQTLTFSRETNAPVRVHLPDLIEEVLTLYARRIADKNLRVIREYGVCEPIAVFPGEMRQVFSNLISNAIEAMSPRGRLVVRIRPGHRWSGRRERGLRFSVGDNGAGIPEIVRRRLGEAFFTTKGQGGTGLGLWVTQSIVSHYAGSLQVRSSVDSARHGTVFSLFLPFHARQLAVFPGGGDAEKIQATGTGTPRWRGLRLIENQAPGKAVDSPTSTPGKAVDSSTSMPAKAADHRGGKATGHRSA